MRTHTYTVTVTWTGNTGAGTRDYQAYARSYTLEAEGKPMLTGSADPAFHGAASLWNPEDLLVAALSACHKLWYLHLCAEAGVTVLAYRDQAVGTMVERGREGGHFTAVTLTPRVVIAEPDRIEAALRLHADAHAKCFIARSMNFPVSHAPRVEAAEARTGP